MTMDTSDKTYDSQTGRDEYNDNRRAMPPPNISELPGPSDWMNKEGPVCDGDYITLRNNAWKGTTIFHSWSSNALNSGGGKEVGTEKMPNHGSSGPSPLPLSSVRMDNRFSWVIRKVIFNTEKAAWVLPSWKAWEDRTPISVTDHVILLCPNDPDMALGTKDVNYAYGNNGDYQVRLEPFPVCTTATLEMKTVSAHFKRVLSFGFWKGDKDNVDFLAQSRCVWKFHNVGANKRSGLILSGSPINIRNMWTEVRAAETSIWEALSSGTVSLVPFIINKTFHGGRNLTQAKGSGGRVVKLALHNNDTDDKAMWIIDAWYGNRYPVQRALIPRYAPPPPPEPNPVPIEVPDLIEQIQHPPPVPSTKVVTYDPKTGTLVHTGLEQKLNKQNPYTWLDYITLRIYGKRWDHLTYSQQLTLVGILVIMGIVAFDVSLNSLL